MVKINLTSETSAQNLMFLRDFCRSIDENNTVNDKLITTSDTEEIHVLYKLSKCSFVYENGNNKITNHLIVPFQHCKIGDEDVYQFLVTSEVWAFLINKQDVSDKICSERCAEIEKMILADMR